MAHRIRHIKILDKNETLLSLKRLRSVLDYKEDGNFYWTKRPSKFSSRCNIGGIAGSVRADGYIAIAIDGLDFRAHRLAWFYKNGIWPKNQIDHRNGNRSDNRISNLREATQIQNCRNSKLQSNNTSGFRGVTWNKRRSAWIARIHVNKKSIYIGYFKLKNEAVTAYEAASAKIFGEFKRIK